MCLMRFFWLNEMKAGDWGYSEGKRLLKEGNKIRMGIQESCMHMDNSNRFLRRDGRVTFIKLREKQWQFVSNGDFSQIFFLIIWEENEVDEKGEQKSANSKVHGTLGSNFDITQNGESVICSSHQQLAPATFKVTMSHSFGFDAEVALADESIFDKYFKHSIFDESVMSDTCLAG